MPSYHTQKQVRHSGQKMFALVADIALYPQFVPMCEALTIRSRREKDGNSLLLADMTVGYKMLRETFTTQVYLRPRALRIDVRYIDGPFKHLENCWQFLPADKAEEAGEQAAADKAAGDSAQQKTADESAERTAAPASAESCIVDFQIDYAFKNPLLSALMGTMFETAFRTFTTAFETRADKIYGA